MEKRHVVASLERVATALGEPLLDAHGVRRFGGHSLRVTGARTLAALGVSLALIQLMARWSSDVVLRYVAEAPLATMTAAYRDGFAAKSLGELGPLAQMQAFHVQAPDVQLDGVAEHTHKEAGEPSPTNVGGGKELPSTLVLNVDSGVVHRPVVWDKEVQPAMWRSTCGWAFGHSNTAPVPKLPSSASLICSGCFRAEKAAARASVLIRSSSSSSSDSSSS